MRDFVFKPVQLRDGLVILDLKLLLARERAAHSSRCNATICSSVFNWVPHERSS